ncbi:MAG: hypothetical protein E7355_00305 [Clostridiales bacterium]|nr:hypothetical protein [Clostridiales bacterium]
MKTLINPKKNHSLKRAIRYIFYIQLFIVFFALFFGVTFIGAMADDGQAEGKAKLNESVKELLTELDLKELENYVDELGNFTDKSVSERLLAYIEGEKFDYASFGKGLLKVLFEKIIQVLPAFTTIAAIALLSGLISTLRSGAIGGSSAEMIFMISYVTALVPLLSVLIECFQVSTTSLSSMSRQMGIVFPIMLTLMASSGGAVSVSVCRPAVAFFSTTIVSVLSNVVLPLTIMIIAFSIAGNFTAELKINKFSAFFKSINKWIIGVCVSVFGIFFTLQGITAATTDGVVRRAAKYAIGNGVPIVGGFLSGGFDLAVAGSVLIKNSLGSMSIFLMVSILFEPLVLLIAVNVLLRFTAAITQPFGDSRISDFLGETAENLHYCTAALLFTAFLYFLCILLLVTSTEALF